MFAFRAIFVVLFVIVRYHEVSGSSILFFHLMATSSHRTSIWPLAEKLAEKGHDVTYIFPIEKRIGSHPKIKEIIPSKAVPILEEFVLKFDTNMRLNNRLFEWTLDVFSKSLELCEAFYDSPEVQQWLKTPNLKFDLLVIDSSLGECAYGLVHKFKAKHILFSPLVPPFMYDGFGIVPESASVPEFFYHRNPKNMGFWDRAVTTFSYPFWRVAFLDWFRKVGPLIQQKMNFTDMPAISDFERNTSMIFINSYFVEDYPMSLPPMFVSYSGLLCSKNFKRKETPLPKKIASFIDESKSFIYISFGSAVLPSTLPENIQKAFFNAFASFPDVRFIWRWPDKAPENIPKNVILHSWLPQIELLAHPKIKGFMMQGGRPSIQEALCYCVPIIGIPFFADQDYNLDRIEMLGGAIVLDINTLNQVDLEESFKQILTNSTYNKRMKEISKIFRDRPIDSVENLQYWTEYVIKYDTSILKPLGMNYTWYQRRLLDVYAFALLLCVIIVGGIVLVLRAMLKICLGRKKTGKAKPD